MYVYKNNNAETITKEEEILFCINIYFYTNFLIFLHKQININLHLIIMKSEIIPFYLQMTHKRLFMNFSKVYSSSG